MRFSRYSKREPNLTFNEHSTQSIPETPFNLSQFQDDANDLPPLFVPLTMLDLIIKWTSFLGAGHTTPNRCIRSNISASLHCSAILSASRRSMLLKRHRYLLFGWRDALKLAFHCAVRCSPLHQFVPLGDLVFHDNLQIRKCTTRHGKELFAALAVGRGSVIYRLAFILARTRPCKCVRGCRIDESGVVKSATPCWVKYSFSAGFLHTH